MTYPLSDDGGTLPWYTVNGMNERARKTYQDEDRAEAQHIRVLIADDRRRSRSGLRALLATRSEIEVIGEAVDGREALRLAEEYRPDVVLMDVRMPRMDGLEATRCIKAQCPEVKVIVLTLYTAHQPQALEAGADAFVSKGDPPDSLLTTLLQLA